MIKLLKLRTYAGVAREFHGKPFIFSRYFRDKVAYFIKPLSAVVPSVHRGVRGDRVSSYLCNYFGTN